MFTPVINKKRTTIYIDEKLLDKIDEMSKSDQRSVSYIISVLLEYAIREKNRKKKATVKVHSEHNS